LEDKANYGALGIDVVVSIPTMRVDGFPPQMIDLHGRPRAIRCYNGSEPNYLLDGEAGGLQ
jgi:hypothetical protein